MFRDVIYTESKVNSFHDVRLVQVKYYGKHVNAASRETRRIRVIWLWRTCAAHNFRNQDCYADTSLCYLLKHYEQFIAHFLRRLYMPAIEATRPTRNILREHGHQDVAEFLYLFGIVFVGSATGKTV